MVADAHVARCNAPATGSLRGTFRGVMFASRPFPAGSLLRQPAHPAPASRARPLFLSPFPRPSSPGHLLPPLGALPPRGPTGYGGYDGFGGYGPSGPSGRAEDKEDAEESELAGMGLSYDADPMVVAAGLGGGFWGPGGALAKLAANLDTCTDTNALQTGLTAAIALEDFQLAAAVRDRLREVAGGGAEASRIDWAATGMPAWLADRAMRLAYRFPTEVQRRTAPVLLSGSDAVVGSETGSGKTLSFLLPLLARLTYPPEMYLDQMKGPQALVVVPTMELGVQVALLAYKLLGGNISSGLPGDDANMFAYFGPKGIKVRGVLNKEEVVMAKSSLTYLSQVHLVVGTPQAVMEAYREPEAAQQLLQHLQVLAVDEVDECFAAFPEDMTELMEAAAQPGGAGNAFGAKPQVVFVGATQRQEVLEEAVGMGWLREPVNIRVGREGGIPSALQHRYILVEPSRRLAALARSLRADLAAAVVDASPARVMLFVNTPAEAAAVAGPLQSSLWTDHRMAVLVPPGTILKQEDDDEPSPSSGASRSGDGASSSGRGAAAAAVDPVEAEAIQSVDDMFAYNPIRALHSFRDNKSSLLLATGAAARGLDLPAVSHVYSLGPPPDATQYLHRAGRAGRIGSTSGGLVTTLVTAAELPALLSMAETLGIEMSAEEEAGAGALPRLAAPEGDEGADGAEDLGDVDKLRRGLDDLYNLM